jgi:teichuronic acid biosynthesis glycosyltransferase TuaG
LSAGIQGTNVTVIVPAFNSAAWLTQTLDAIRAQSFENWEAIVADDASTDDTPRIVQAYCELDARFRYLRMPANTGGPAGPRNAALAQATTHWVAFCDADDLWHPRKLALQLEVASSRASDLVCSAIQDFKESAPDTGSLADGHGKALPSSRVGLWRLLGKNVIPGSTVLCRRDAIADAGGFDTSPQLVAVEDYDLWIRLLERGAVATKIDTPLVAYRRLPGSLSSRKLVLARRVTLVLRRHFQRSGRPAMFYVMAPWLMLSYACQSLYLRVWKGRL